MKTTKEIVQEASDAVEILEGTLKTEAFKKILDKLLEENSQRQPPRIFENISKERLTEHINKRKKRVSKKIETPFVLSGKKMRAKSMVRKKELAGIINRTKHPLIHNLNTTLLRSLYVLKIMRKKNIDGLTPPEIAYILQEVFRIKARYEAVSVALKNAHKYVDRGPILVGKTTAYVYRIMKPGEDHLASNLHNTHIPKTNEEELQTLSDV